MKQKTSLILFGFLLLNLFGCVNESKKKEADILAQKNDSINRQRIEYLLPSPQELMSFVKDEGLTYKENSIYPLVDIEKINLFRNQSLYFGMYFCDYYYLSVYEKNTQSLKYLTTLREFSVKLGIEHLFKETYFKRMEANSSNLDSLKQISVELSSAVFNSLDKSDNNMVFSIIGIGSIVEALYITSNSITDVKSQPKLVSSVYDIGEFYENFFGSFLVFCKDESSLKPLLNDLTTIREILKQGKEERANGSTTTKKTNANGVKIKISDNNKGTTSEENFNLLKNKVTIIRNKIVNQQY
jgi:hypothetical protein